jgi:hypothetical protein
MTFAVSTAVDYSLVVSPNGTGVATGSAAFYWVSINALNGFGGTVSLAASGLPAGGSMGFSPASVTTGDPASILTVVTGSIPVNNYTIHITGASGGLTRSTDVPLYVLPPSQTINFAAVNDIPLGGTSVSISASATSGLTVSLVSTTPSICTLSGASGTTITTATVTAVATGPCTIKASSSSAWWYSRDRHPFRIPTPPQPRITHLMTVFTGLPTSA